MIKVGISTEWRLTLFAVSPPNEIIPLVSLFSGQPVLPVNHQVFIHKLMILGAQFLLAGEVQSREEDLAYRRYIDYLYL